MQQEIHLHHCPECRAFWFHCKNSTALKNHHLCPLCKPVKKTMIQRFLNELRLMSTAQRAFFSFTLGVVIYAIVFLITR